MEIEMKVWITTRFSFTMDSYVTEGVFSTLEKATDYTELPVNRTYEWNIEEWDLDQGLMVE